MFGGAKRFFRDRLTGYRIAADDMDADVARAPDEVVDHRAVQDLKPPRSRRFADHNLCNIVSLRVINHVVGDVPITSGKGNGFATQRFRKPQRVGNAITLFFR